MKKLFVLFFLFIFFVSLNTEKIAQANMPQSQTPPKTILSSNIGTNVLNQILRQQELNNESNNLTQKSHISKLTSNDEAILLYEAMVEIDNFEFHDFTYTIEEIEVYKNSEEKIIVEAYIIRTFILGDEKFETSLGDYIILELKEDMVQLNTTENVSSLKNAVVLENSSDLGDIITKEEFLKIIFMRVIKSPK